VFRVVSILNKDVLNFMEIVMAVLLTDSSSSTIDSTEDNAVNTSDTAIQPKSPSPPTSWRAKHEQAEQAPQQPAEFDQPTCEPVQISTPESIDNCTPQSQPEKMSVSVLSNKSLADWRGSITLFKGFYRTTPAGEMENASWSDLSKLLCPAKPDILQEKCDGKYFIPCLLKNAPLVGHTAEIAKFKGRPLFGKMRSKNHVTESSTLLIDLDGMSKDEFMSCMEQLKAAGITFVAYTTHSHGRPEKPGMRVRLAIPLDHPVSLQEYAAAWHGFDQMCFAGKVNASDPSGARMYQQQGVWSCHPSRIRHAQSWQHEAGVASAATLIEIGKNILPTTNTESYCTGYDIPTPLLPTETIINLLECIDPDIMEPRWFRVLGAVHKTTHGSIEGLEIVDAWSSNGCKYKGSRDVEKRWKFYSNNENRINLGTLIFEAKQAGADVSAIMQQADAFEICESEDPGSDEVDLAATPDIPDLEPLAALQQQFGLLSISGKLCIFDRADLATRTEQHTARKLLLSNRSDGALLIERALRATYPDAEDPKGIVKLFFVHPDTVCYSGIEFNPKGTSENHLNLWEGPTIIPQDGPWLGIQDFLYEIICNFDWESYLYLIKYIAHALLKPEEKPGVMIILIGGQGIGKGTLARIFQKIWSATYIQINNVEEVVGTFNAILERSYIIFMDEALFSGNRRGTDELKSIVTEPIIQISEKYQPSRQIRSVHRFIASTNADHFKNTERDDRRDFTLRVSEARKKDHNYWVALADEIKNGGVEAMVYDLMNIDLSDFNIRQKPNTKELVEQKLHSLDPIQRWWHDGLYNGAFGKCVNWMEFISTSDVIDGIIEVNGGRMHKKPSALIISQALHKLCPSAKQHQQQTKYDRHRGYLLPTLQQARAEFEQYIGGSVEWPEVEQADGAESHAPLGADSDLRAPDF
jgi:hypothetical protein